LPSALAQDELGASPMEDYKGEKIQGLVPFMLNNRYNKVSDILSEDSFGYEVVLSDIHSILDHMKKW